MRLLVWLLLSGSALAAAADPIAQWQFTRDRLTAGAFADLVGGRSVPLTGPVAFDETPAGDVLALDGLENSLTVTDNLASFPLPRREFSIEAWARWDVPRAWGGLLSAMQDNGDAEQGFVLGYSGEEPSFSLATTGTDDGDGRMTHLVADADHGLSRWHHIVGTYDGATMRLYVNGALDTTSTEQSGDVLYPDEGWVELGAYRDINEYFRLQGNLLEVALYDRVLGPEEVARRYEKHADLAQLPGPLQTPRIVVEPFLQYPTTSGMGIVWETWPEATTVVEYGDRVPLTERVEVDGRRALHQVRLENLQPGTAYFYRVRSVTDAGAELTSEISTFAADVQPGAAWAFAILGDTQNNPAMWRRLSRHIWGERPNLVFLAGDLVGSGQIDFEWEHEFFGPGRELLRRIPLLPVLGNHENDAANYYKYFALPEPEYWYTFRYGNADFLMLDSNRDMKRGSEQYRWAEQQLKAMKGRWRFVVHHHPPYSSDENDYGDTYRGPSTLGDRTRLGDIVKLYEKYDVDVVFYGHVHDYERTWPLRSDRVDQENGVVYMQVGGGGGGLEDYAPTRSWFTAKVRRDHHFAMVAIHDGTLRLQAIDREGRLFDTLELRK